MKYRLTSRVGIYVILCAENCSCAVIIDAKKGSIEEHVLLVCAVHLRRYATLNVNPCYSPDDL
jgi:hypothetical protein